jgi:uncharacterized protein (TIGR03083 family)
MILEPLPVVDAMPLVREVDQALIPLLRGLEPGDWQRSAVGSWTVRDVAAHLLDGALRRLSLDRDGHQPPAADWDLSDYGELVGFLDELNASWVGASQRLSPPVIIDLLEHACPQMADYFESLDPAGEARFPVSWAGEASSRVWMDVAREYTERWHHQQQIREAVGAPGLDREPFVRPLLETLVRALPRSYEALDATTGSLVTIAIDDLEGVGWALQREDEGWVLGLPGPEAAGDAVLRIPAEPTWRLFTKGIDGQTAKQSATIAGDQTLVEPFFTTLAVMA